MARLSETAPTRTFRYSVALDNYSPTRDFGAGTGDLYAPDTAWNGQSETIILHNVDNFGDFERTNFIVDDGESVRAFYLSGWNQPGTMIYLSPFPTNTGAIRPDNGRPVDYSQWALGPRKTFHLKITWQGEAPKPTYAQYQTDRVIASGADTFAIKVETRGAGEDSTDTKWLNITPAQLSAIRAILGSED